MFVEVVYSEIFLLTFFVRCWGCIVLFCFGFCGRLVVVFSLFYRSGIYILYWDFWDLVYSIWRSVIVSLKIFIIDSCVSNFRKIFIRVLGSE